MDIYENRNWAVSGEEHKVNDRYCNYYLVHELSVAMEKVKDLL